MHSVMCQLCVLCWYPWIATAREQPVGHIRCTELDAVSILGVSQTLQKHSQGRLDESRCQDGVCGCVPICCAHPKLVRGTHSPELTLECSKLVQLLHGRRPLELPSHLML